MPSRLRMKRVEKGLTQYELERKTGIKQARLSLIENGFRAPKRSEQKTLAEVLDCTVEEIASPDWEAR